MPGWTLIDTDPTPGCTFQRPLGTTERALFWDGLFNGNTDTLRHLELRLLNGAVNGGLFSKDNIARAWTSTKRRYPLAGAIVQQQERGVVGTDLTVVNSPAGFTVPHFVVRESDLRVLRPDEIVFGQVANATEAQQRAAAILNGSRPLSEELLAKLYVFRETDSERTRTGILHVMVLTAHCVTDGTAGRTLLRCFLDTLARGGGSEAEPAQMLLEDRLAMAVPLEELEPMHLCTLSPARRRWRRAVAAVIIQPRFAKKKGGHTLPCRFTHSTAYTAAHPGLVETSLTQTQSATVIAKCRQHRITFGNAYLALAQVAMTRVLYRRYLSGEISEEEWTYRKRQPYINDGPVNLRQHLDKTWFESGGGGEFMVSVSGYSYSLPFMTLSGTDHQHKTKLALSDGAPPFSDLLTFDRFLHRAGLVKKQAAAFFNHPLFFEMMHRLHQLGAEYRQYVALRSQETGNHNGNLDEDDVLAATDIPSIAAHGGSSLGNVDAIFPFEYPIPPDHALSPYSPVSHHSKTGYVPPSPYAPKVDTSLTIAVESLRSHLHTRAGELYLGAVTWRGQLSMYVWYDGNVFEEEVVREWLNEVKGAVLWYLG